MSEKRSNNTPINVRQDQFAYEYASNGGNACEAYRIVYGQGKYTDDQLAHEASQLRNSQKVAKRIEEYRERIREESKAEKSEAIKVLLNIMRANPTMLTYTDPKSGKTRMRTPQQLHRVASDAIKTMTNDQGKVNYTFESKTKAIEILAGLLGWNKPQEHKLSGNVGMFGGELGIIPDSLAEFYEEDEIADKG